MKSKSISFLVLFAVVLLTSSCAESHDIAQHISGTPSGFFEGVIHGMILPISFITSLFDENIAIYAVHNSGWTYDLGFMIGSGAFGGTFLSSSSNKKSS